MSAKLVSMHYFDKYTIKQKKQNMRFKEIENILKKHPIHIKKTYKNYG